MRIVARVYAVRLAPGLVLSIYNIHTYIEKYFFSSSTFCGPSTPSRIIIYELEHNVYACCLCIYMLAGLGISVTSLNTCNCNPAVTRCSKLKHIRTANKNTDRIFASDEMVLRCAHLYDRLLCERVRMWGRLGDPVACFGRLSEIWTKRRLPVWLTTGKKGIRRTQKKGQPEGTRETQKYLYLNGLIDGAQ